MTHPFLDVARPLALEAASLLMKLRRAPLSQERKADRSLVTNADREADAMIRQGLLKAFPKHAILTEESGLAECAGAEYVWVVDPLDGTKAYVQGIAGFSVMVGVLREGRPYAGVVVDPWEGHIYEAVRDQGAYHIFQGERTRVRVSPRNDWSSMPVITSTGFPAALQSALLPALSGPWLPQINSVGIKVGLVVRQLADIYINHHLVHYWDTCAPQIILEEAGGIMTFLDGKPLSYALDGKHMHPQPTLATNATRHDEALGLIRKAMQRGER